MQLEWKIDEKGNHLAYGVVRGYRIRYESPCRFFVTVDNFPIGEAMTLDTAKGIAQQHNDR